VVVKVGEAAAKVEGGHEGGRGEVLEKAVVARGVKAHDEACGSDGQTGWQPGIWVGWRLAACPASETWPGFTFMSIAT